MRAGGTSGATERGGHALEVYVRPGVQPDGAVRVRGARRACLRGHSGHGRHLPPSGAAGRVGDRLADLVMTLNARPAPVVPGCAAGEAGTAARGGPDRLVRPDRGRVAGAAVCGTGVSPRSRMPAATARTSRAARPRPRYGGPVHTAPVSVQPAAAASPPPRRRACPGAGRPDRRFSRRPFGERSGPGAGDRAGCGRPDGVRATGPRISGTSSGPRAAPRPVPQHPLGRASACAGPRRPRFTNAARTECVAVVHALSSGRPGGLTLDFVTDSSERP